MISRRGFFAVLAGVLAAPKALFGKKKFVEVPCKDYGQVVVSLYEADQIPRSAKEADRVIYGRSRPVFMGREAGRLAFGFSPDQVDEINRRSAEECRRLGIPMLKA